jgi:hydrogenase-4 component B
MTMSSLLILTWLVPLAAAALTPVSGLWWLPAIAPLPALTAAALVPAGHAVEIPWLLLGSVLGFGETGRIFLAFTSVLWLAAGLYAATTMRAGPHAGRFRVFFLLAMAGNLWLIVGQDLASFYLGFSLMGLASYGLVIHEGDQAALAELALFVALVLIARHAGSLVPAQEALVGLDDLAVGLLIFGLAIKAGLVPLHVWLPLAHPAAPVPASAVLSGAMIKVALLGWLRFLPLGQEVLTDWGLLLVFGGLLTLYFAIPVGLVQTNPKVILAYSSVSKMGLLALTLGLVLLRPDLAPAGVLAISLYAAHHALVKGGLFLGVGLRHHAGMQGLVLAGITVLALSLAGVPASSGAVAKYGIKPALVGIDWSWLTSAVTLSTTATGLLMARFLWVIWHMEPHPRPGYALGGVAWGGLVGLTLLFPLVLGTPGSWAANAGPIAVAAALALPVALVAWRKPELLRPAVGTVRPGDLIYLIRPLLAVLGFALGTLVVLWDRLLLSGWIWLTAAVATVRVAGPDPEAGLRRWPNAGVAWLATMALLLVLGLGTWSVEKPPAQPLVVDLGPAASPPPAEPTGPDPAGGAVAPVGPDFAASASGGPTSAEAVGTGMQAVAGVAPGPHREVPLRIPMTTPEPAEVEVPLEPSIAGTPVVTRETPEVQVPEVELPDREPPRQVPAGPAGQAGSGPAEDAQVMPPEADTAGGAGVCDPDQPFVFGHPAVEKPLTLWVCARGPDGPRRLDAPPLTKPLVALVQRHLNDLGYAAGPVDGLFGPRTRGAIYRFQGEQGIRTTEAITFDLLERLRVATKGAAGAGSTGRGDSAERR